MDTIAAMVGLSLALGNLGPPVGLPPEKLNPVLAGGEILHAGDSAALSGKQK